MGNKKKQPIIIKKEDRWKVEDTIYTFPSRVYFYERKELQDRFNEKIWIEWNDSNTKFVITLWDKENKYYMKFLTEDFLKNTQKIPKTEAENLERWRGLNNLYDYINTNLKEWKKEK